MTTELYKISGKIGSLGCKLMNNVSHVAHIDTAVEILRTGRIKSSLIFDESKLNTERIKVIWLSPNEWVDGYLYGTIRFNFDVNRLFSEDKKLKFYWVEVMTYTPHACRILVTSKEYDLEKYKLEPYDLTDKNGIWWYDTEEKKHYFNNNFTLEIMFEVDNIALKEHSFIDLVKHHRDYCNMKKKLDNDICLEQKDEIELIGAKFLNALIVHNFKSSPKNKITIVGLSFGKNLIATMIKKLEKDISGSSSLGKLELNDKEKKVFLYAILNFYASGQISEIDTLTKILSKDNNLKEYLDSEILALRRRTFSFNIKDKEYKFDVWHYFEKEDKIESKNNYIYILTYVNHKTLNKNLTYGDFEFYHVGAISSKSILSNEIKKVKDEKGITKMNTVLTYKVDENGELEIIKNKIIEKITKEKKGFSNEVV
jgi:hypothetical protein